MGRIDWLAGVMACLAAAPAALNMGCVFGSDLTNCSDYPHDSCAGLGTGGPAGTGGSVAHNPLCDGDPTAKNVTEECGVFVRADATGTTEDGSRTNPYKSLATALAHAGGKRVFACISAPFAESLTVKRDVVITGGFDCAKDWAWSAEGRTRLNGSADQPALTLASGAGGARVENFAIFAPSAVAAGRSSVGVAVDAVTAALVRCDISAGDGAKGEDGQPATGSAARGGDAASADPTTENACINPSAVTGGVPGESACDGGASRGGAGGKGGVTAASGGDGQSGDDGAPAVISSGLGGAGESTTKCTAGAAGADGTAGEAGSGGSALGALTLSGVVTTESTDGQPGKMGQGGGGGGGAKAGIFCQAGLSTVDGPGASGGGGGGGGCGGKGGAGGKAGGSSIAIISLGTKLTLTNVTLTTGKGGSGGAGAPGQTGGDPGSGAAGGTKSPLAPSTSGCKGGDGGSGGPGGVGAGGRGGHSISIAYRTAPHAAPSVAHVTLGVAGDGGGPGGVAPDTSKGSPGRAAVCWDFKSNAACP